MTTITNFDSDTKDKLETLVQLNADAAEGFKDAADSLDDASAASLFHGAAAERANFRDQLKTVLNINEGDSPDGGTVKGSIHRAWLNIRSAINGGDPEVLYTEAHRGETSLRDAYRETEESCDAPDLCRDLHAQRMQVEQMVTRLEALKEQAS